jgi:hypothetical protein
MGNLAMTELKAKKKHHYVPQFYLKKWLTLEGLWIKNKINHKEKIYPKKSTKDIAEENNFYGIEIDDVVWDMLAYRFEDDTKSNEIVRIVMNGFWNLKIFDDIISKKIWAVNHDESLLNSAKKTLDHLKNTYLEDAYSHMESEVSKKINIFNKVQDSNLWTPLPTDTYSSLIVFFAFQLFRTKDVRSRLENNITDLCLSREDEKIILTENQKETFFKCLLYIFSIQFCMRIESLGFHMVIHKNRTKQAYLTSDCPANYYDKQKHPHLPCVCRYNAAIPKAIN